MMIQRGLCVKLPPRDGNGAVIVVLGPSSGLWWECLPIGGSPDAVRIGVSTIVHADDIRAGSVVTDFLGGTAIELPILGSSGKKAP